jgi:hypothetical protein
MMQLYLSPKGLADLKKRVSKEDSERLDTLVKDGQIKIVPPNGNGSAPSQS